MEIARLLAFHLSRKLWFGPKYLKRFESEPAREVFAICSTNYEPGSEVRIFSGAKLRRSTISCDRYAGPRRKVVAGKAVFDGIRCSHQRILFATNAAGQSRSLGNISDSIANSQGTGCHAGLVEPWRQPMVGADALRSVEAAWAVETGPEAERDHGADPGCGHKPSAGRVVAHGVDARSWTLRCRGLREVSRRRRHWLAGT
jgi:hypothetical protein